ncbi:TPA: hypothetical protein MIC21_29465 [Klebsiella pneumoniae]|nr:hypothetical protein [Klebsiella pneumoniae]
MPNEWKDQYRKGERRRTLLFPADGFHQKLIVHRRAFIQPQTLLPAFIRKFFRFITVTLYRQWKKERVWYLDTL